MKRVAEVTNFAQAAERAAGGRDIFGGRSSADRKVGSFFMRCLASTSIDFNSKHSDHSTGDVLCTCQLLQVSLQTGVAAFCLSLCPNSLEDSPLNGAKTHASCVARARASHALQKS